MNTPNVVRIVHENAEFRGQIADLQEQLLRLQELRDSEVYDREMEKEEIKMLRQRLDDQTIQCQAAEQVIQDLEYAVDETHRRMRDMNRQLKCLEIEKMNIIREKEEASKRHYCEKMDMYLQNVIATRNVKSGLKFDNPNVAETLQDDEPVEKADEESLALRFAGVTLPPTGRTETYEDFTSRQ